MFSYTMPASIVPPNTGRRGGPAKLESFLPELMVKLVAGTTIDPDPPPAPGARLAPPLPRAA